MRSKTLAAVLLSTGAVALPLGAQSALAAPAQDPVVQTCTSLGLLTQPICEVLDQVTDALAPADPVVEPVVEATAPVVEATAPVGDAVAPVADTVGGALPAPAPTSPTSPAPESGTTGGTATPAGGGATATSSGSPTGFSAPVSSGRTTAPADRYGSARPSVPSGAPLSLSPLGVPSFSVGSAFASPSLDTDLPLPGADSAFAPIIEAVTAGAASSSDESKATAAILALSMLALAAGLLIDQVRKAGKPVHL